MIPPYSINSNKGFAHLIVLATIALFGIIFLYVFLFKGSSQFAATDSSFIKIGGGQSLESSNSVEQTADGGYITVGTTAGTSTGTDLLFTKFDQIGNVTWSKAFRGTGSDIGYKIQPTADGGYIILGMTDSFGDEGNTLLVKFGSDDEPAWAKTTGGNFFLPKDLRQTSDGGYIVTGQVNGQSLPWGDLSLIKYDGSGNVEWSKAVDGSLKPIIGESVEQTADGGYVVTGTYGGQTIPSTGDRNVLLAKFDSSGNSIWIKTAGGSGDEAGLSVKEATDGYIVSGWSSSFGSGAKDLLLTKFDQSGIIIWSKNVTSNAESGRSIELLNDGYLVVGAVNNSGSNNLSITKFDLSGNLLWAKSVAKDSSLANSVSKTSNGGFIITGDYSSSNGDMFIIKTDPQGNVSNCSDLSSFSPIVTDVQLNPTNQAWGTASLSLNTKRQQLQRLTESFNFNVSSQCPAQSASPSPSQKPGRKPTK